MKDLNEIKEFVKLLKQGTEYWLRTGKEPESEELVNFICDVAGETGNHLHFEDDTLNRTFLNTIIDHADEILKNIASIDEAGVKGEPALERFNYLCNLTALLMIETYDSNRDVFSWFGLHQDNMKYLKNALRNFKGVEVPAWELLRYAKGLYDQEVFNKLVDKILKQKGC